MGNYLVLEHSDYVGKAGILDTDDLVVEYYPYSQLSTLVNNGVYIEGIQKDPFRCRNVAYYPKRFDIVSAKKKGLCILQVTSIVSMASEYKCTYLYTGRRYENGKVTAFVDQTVENIRQMRGVIGLGEGCTFEVENGYDDISAGIRLIAGGLKFSDDVSDRHVITAQTNFASTSNYTEFFKAFLVFAKNGILFNNQL